MNAKIGRAHHRRLSAIGAIIVSLLVAVLVSAPGASVWGAQEQQSSPSSGTITQYTTPAARGDLSQMTWDLPTGEPTTLDYVQAGDYSPDTLVSNLCDYLLRLQPNWTLAPGLATSWSYPNKTTLVFNIRHGVRFWDGHQLTAADVAYSLQRNMIPADQPVNGNFFANVKQIKQTGPYQVTVLFSKPDELFIKEMATVAGGVAEMAYLKAKGAKYGTAKGGVMCSGPYELRAWHAGSDIVLTRNPHYWDAAYRAHVQTVTVKFIVNTSTLVSALLSGEIDGTYEVSPVSIPELKAAHDGTLYFGPSLAVVELAAASTHGPMANPKIRQALSMAIDRNALINSVYSGAGIANKTLTPPTAWDPAARDIYKAAYEALPSLTPNIAAAKKLVAGQPNSHQIIKLAILGGDQTQLEVASVVQQAAQQIGLNVQIKQMQALDFSNLFYLPQYRKGIDLVLSNGYLDVADPMDYLVLFIGPNAVFNWIDYNDPTVLHDVTLARQTYNAAQRARLITAAQQRYMASEIVIPLVNPDEALFMNHRLTGAPASFAYIYEPSLALVGSA